MTGAFLSRVGRNAGVAPPPTSGLAPSSQWNGTAGSGFGGAFAPIPTDPVRTTAKPWCRPLWPNWLTVTQDMYWGVDAGADKTSQGGIASVQFILEGATYTVTTQSFAPFVDVNGATQTTYGFQCPLDVSAWLAQNPNGEADMYVVVTANDVTMQQRVMGPYRFYARTTEFTVTKTVGVGGDYTNIKDGLTYARTNPTQRVRLLLLNTANYPIDTQASSFLSAKWWTVIEAASGVSATIGNGTKTMTQCGYDGIQFRGFGIKWDIAQLGYNLASAWRFSNGSANRLWLNGVDGPYCGTMNPAHGGSGSGAAALINGFQVIQFYIGGNDPTTAWHVYFTECAAHDLPGYGLSFCKLRRNSTAINISGSDAEVPECVHGGYTDKAGGYYSGLGTFTPAFNLTYSGGSSCAYEKTGANGHSGAFNIYIPSGAASPTYSYPLTGGTMAALVTWINGLGVLGLSAVLQPPSNLLADVFLSKDGNPPSAGISKTTLSGTVALKRIQDIHADILVWHGDSVGPDDTLENIAVRFFENRNSVSSAFISVNGDVIAKDWGIRNISNQDTSVSLGQATQPGYWSGTRQHVIVQYESNTNPSGNRFLTGSTSDSYCGVDHCATPLTIAPAPVTAGSITSLAAPALPAGSDSNSKTVSTDQTLLYAAPFATPPDFTPKTTLKLPDTSYAGRYTSTGAEQGV